MRRGGARAFDFNEPVKREVIGRQQGLCASCGTSFSTSHSAFPNFHHVIPNQAGNPADPADAFLRESDNCVMLCDECHDSAHDSNTTSGGMAPPDFFLHSHGGDRVAHQAWAQQLAAQTPSRWR
jgi:5-methylcytosine-specific restriction endonuclease McrA